MVGVEEKFRPLAIEVEPKVMPLVIPLPIAPELVILKASVTTVEPVPDVSALSRSNKAATALSVVLEVSWFWIRIAYSVLPATLGLFVKFKLIPAKPAVFEVVLWA